MPDVAFDGDEGEATTRTTAPADDSPAEAVLTRRTDDTGGGEVEAEATRRTNGKGNPNGGVAVDDEATRRTGTAGPALPPPSPGTGGAVTLSGAAEAPPRGAKRRRTVAIAAALGLLVLIVNEVSVWSAAKQLRVDLATSQSSETHALWDRYQELSGRSLLRVGVVGLRGPLRDRLMAQAERVIADYRQDAPAVREAQWRQASTWLTDVLHLDPGDRVAAARLRYCEGHLQRIDGETRKRRKQPAVQPLHVAVQKFEEASRLDSRWPDPYLGLARTYIYGLDDLDRAIAALHEAEDRGYRPGNRELVQLADGYRSRAERMRRDAAGVRGLEQEKDYLEKALEDYRQSFDLYRKAMGFGEVSAAMRQVQSRMDEVAKRLEEIKPRRTLGDLLRDIIGR
ncbi:MAG: hypothetical protein EHM24_27245 [Acidobacteria bacterium]|nr:MAG: hypothetical protein EHM24_27245 [Acidobacteriota bacterium]RPJ84177.1 MAG: hypothetical protein EHM13_05500 [Acidobacteriota bacterium]